MSSPYSPDQPERAQIEAMPGLAVLQFGADWCGHCQAAEEPVNTALAAFPEVRQIKVEDGPGRHLGRSYRVRLWPTLIFLRRGQEVARLVRPTAVEPVCEALTQLTAGNDGA